MGFRGEQGGARIDWYASPDSIGDVHVLTRFQGHGWDVKCVEWHPTKGLLASGSKDNLIKFWDPRTGTVLSTL